MKQLQLLMGMPIIVEIVDPNVTEAAIENVFAYFRYVDDTFSIYKESSEISKINRGELSEEAFSDDMKTILALSEQTKQETRGYFDIRHNGIFDPSGIVKGWAIFQAAQMLQDAGWRNFYIDAGGDIQVSGTKGGHPWRIGIRNPFNRSENVKVLTITDKGIATSGTAIRGQHIYDPHRPDASIEDIVSLLQGLPLTRELQQLLVASPLIFFAAIMLTEPLTAPPTQKLKRIYGVIVGVLFIPQMHLGPIYSTPELALVIGNIYSYLVSPKQKVVLKLKRKRKVSSNIADFVFRPSQRLVFKPGQYMEFTLAHRKPDSRGNRRFFTLASSPTEESLHLGVRFYADSSSFKKALYSIDGRTTMMAGQIAGDFTLPDDSEQKLVFIAGGIGITPFRSMLKYLLDMRQPRDIVLLYANKTANEIVYQDILNEAQMRLGIRVFYTLTDTEALPRNWRGLVGRIHEGTILRAIPDYQERTYYVSGPSDMVRAFEHILKNMGVKQNQIKKDFFPGLV